MVTDRHNHNDIVSVVRTLKKQNLKVAMCTGCYDIVHCGHIDMFRFAKTHADRLIVGLDSDASIRLTKGETRPINGITDRLQFVIELSSVDYVFEIKQKFKFGDEQSDTEWKKLLKDIKPNLLVTSADHDHFATKKQAFAQNLDIEFLSHSSQHPRLSSTLLIKEYLA